MEPKIILFIFIIIFIYSLYYTYNYDFGMFLYFILLITLGFLIYYYIEYKMNLIYTRVNNLQTHMNNLHKRIDVNISNIDFIKNIMMTLFNQKN